MVAGRCLACKMAIILFSPTPYLTRGAVESINCVLADSAEIADCLVGGLGNIDWSQFVGALESCDIYGVALVGL